MSDTATPPWSERFTDVGRGITLCYERIGDPAGEPLVLIAGLGQQLHTWPDAFCAELARRGYAIVRFDNRDVGRSTHMPYPPPSLIAMLRGRGGPRQYHLGDMARDTMGLLDALGLDSVHLVGASMGGMIAQTLAAHAPWRVRSLTSIMSNTGAPKIGRPALGTWLRMLKAAPKTRAEAIDQEVRMYRHIGSHGFPLDEAWLRETTGRAWDRDPTAEGVARQLTAIFATGDRTLELAGIQAPTVVIHGDRDPMVHPTGGMATARAIPGAQLETIKGMGHDLPRGAWPRLIDLIDANARRTQRADVTTTPSEQESSDAEVTA
jgi:pimeloyl-ACP methyl ester carboxylesterase